MSTEIKTPINITIDPKEETKELVTPVITSAKNTTESSTKEDKEVGRTTSSGIEDFEAKSDLFQLVKFSELKSDIITSEKEHFQNNNGTKGKDPGATSFEKKFNPQNGERLLDSFTCAISKKMLLHGRLYITDQRLCFYSMFNSKLLFFGKETKLTIPHSDIKGLEKRINALVFDNSIAVITKKNTEYFFTSFLKRDKAFEAIRQILERDAKPNRNSHNTSLLKRTYIRLDTEENKDEPEEEEEESDIEDQGNIYTEEPTMNLTGDKSIKPDAALGTHQDDEAGNQPQSDRPVKLSLISKDQRAQFEQLCDQLEENYSNAEEELDPSSHKDYYLANEYTVEDMSIQ
mmetsp:Transcript_7682/g.7226  ORF Transcript_7682/g.7226 Transcript_7682/m.7226 type:complete len:346 (-) Transcript_7682:737-1774(-)